MPINNSRRTFSLGQTVMTRGIAELVNSGQLNPLTYLRRHAQCDWGDLSHNDKVSNNQALKSGDRLFSCYNVTENLKIYVITEWDRSVTTMLLPCEY